MAHADIDPTSKTWRTVQALARKTIEVGLMELAQPRVNEREADVLRGNIQLAQVILDLADDDDGPVIHDASHVV